MDNTQKMLDEETEYEKRIAELEAEVVRLASQAEEWADHAQKQEKRADEAEAGNARLREGLVMVPIEPTFEMIDEACYCAETDLDPFPVDGDNAWTAQQAHDFMRAAYNAMLSAGRIKPGQDEESDDDQG